MGTSLLAMWHYAIWLFLRISIWLFATFPPEGGGCTEVVNAGGIPPYWSMTS